MELLVRSVFNTTSVREVTKGVKKELHDTIVNDEDVAFHWSMLTVEVEEAERVVMLGMIIDLYVM